MRTVNSRTLSGTAAPGFGPVPFRNTQQGAILLITLVSLALLMLSTMALIRSFDTSLSMAGNLAFKRDLSNQAERGMAKAIALVKGGTLGTASLAGSNYSAAYLNSNAHGLPLALINSPTSSADIDDTTAQIKVLYVIDRQCNSVGIVDVSKDCSFVNIGNDSDPTFQPVYRISVRASGPRDTQVYLQSTVTN
ncbi:MAG: hypothetical protein WA049_09415 [Ferribacterium limneticum]